MFLGLGCCCGPVNPCVGCYGAFPSAFNVLDSNYGASTITFDPVSGEWRGTGSAPGITGVTQLHCFASISYLQTTLTAPFRYRFFCTVGPPRQPAFFPEFSPCLNPSTGDMWPTNAFDPTAAVRHSPHVTLDRVDNSVCAHLDMTFNVTASWTNPLWHPDGLYSGGGTIRVWAP